MRAALLVSYYFPPRFSVGGKRAYRFAKHLPRHGWKTTVLTAKAPESERLDPSFSDADLTSCDVRRDYLSAEELARMPKRAFGSDGTLEAPTEAWTPPAARTGLSRLRHELRPATVIGPDAAMIPALSGRIARLAKQSGAEVVFATGAPWEAVVAATLAATALRLPLVVEFRDPWSFGPVVSRHPAWARAAVGLVERAVLRAASALVVTTETTREEYARRVPHARIACIRSGYDDDFRVEPRPSEAPTFVHFGNCYGERSLAPFLRALAAVVRRKSLVPGEARILNLGRVARADLDLAAELGVAPFFEHRTVLPYAEGVGVVAGADLALLPSFGVEPWFIAGKLYDYLLAGTPILATSASPEIERILASTRLGWSHPSDDVEALARRMEEALDARAAGRPLAASDASVMSALTAGKASERLARLFDEVTLSRG